MVRGGGKAIHFHAEDHNKIINLVAIENGESAMREVPKVLRGEGKKRENENEMNLRSSEAHVK